nr:3-oxo-5-alpha-steroid 4-dehydrogenase-domain-containing protein [Flammulina filiformis]
MAPLIVHASGNKPPAFAKNVFPLTIEVGPEDPVSHLKSKIVNRCPKFHTSRQKLSLKGQKAALDDETKLKDLGLGAGGEIDIKDLGPQLSWKLVFVVEYLGPLLIHPVFYHFPQLLYGKAIEHSAVQKTAYAMIMLHFAKREFETLFIHRFSHGTMPVSNIFKNSAHYHILSGLFLAFDLYRSKYSATSPYIQQSIMNNPTFLKICVGLWTFFQLSNLHTHLTFRRLRPAGSKRRAVPRGYGFNLVSSPNYLFEILGWTVVTVMTQSYAAALFLLVGGGQMAIWAAKKHRNYKKEFGKEYPRSRKAMVPFIF